MKSPFLRDFLTGVCTLGGFGVFAGILLLFGELRGVGDRRYTMYVRLDTAAGVNDSSPVSLNGVRVGTVQRLAPAPDDPRAVDLALRVREGVAIPSNAQVFLDRSLVGDSILDFYVPEGLPVAPAVEPGGRLTLRAETLVTRISRGVEEPLKELSRLSARFDELSLTYTEVGRNINRLVEPRTPADVQQGAAPNLASVIGRVDTVLADAESWLGDETLRQDAREAVTRLKDTLDSVKQAAAELENSAQVARQRVDTLSTRVESSLNNADATIQETRAAVAQGAQTLRHAETAATELGKLIQGVNSGAGTLGRLAQDPELYNSMRDAAKRLERALTEVQLLAEKYRAEGIRLKL